MWQIDATDSGVESLLHDQHPLAVIQGQRGGFGEMDVEVSGCGIGPHLKSRGTLRRVVETQRGAVAKEETVYLVEVVDVVGVGVLIPVVGAADDLE